MTLLAPWAGIIGAAIAVPVLLALYLLRLRRRPLRVSSTLLWEQAAQDLQVNVPLRMLRWSSLLALHLLALASLLLALARPAMGEGGATGSRIVIVIDRSASMSATDMPPSQAGGPPTSRLDAARVRANNLLDSIGRAGAGVARPRCMLISMADGPEALTAFTTDLRLVKEALSTITPSDQPENLAATLQLIEAMTAEAGSEDEGAGEAAPGTPPTVYLVTDGVIELPGEREGRAINSRLVPLIIGDATNARAMADNIGIVAVSARFDADDPGLVRVFARLINSGPSPLDLAVRCIMDGEVPGDGVLGIRVPAAQPAADAPNVPGEAAAVFAVRSTPSPSARTVIVSINRADSLLADDSAGMVLQPPWRARVLIVAPDGPQPAGEPVPDVFLLQALEAAEPASIRVVGAGAIAPALWATADVVIFDRVAPETLPPLPSLSFGATLPISGLSIVAGETGGSATALAWQREHPTLSYAGLDALIVAPAAALQFPASGEKGSDQARRFSVLIDGTIGSLMIGIEEGLAGTRSVRRLVVAFDLARSNWGPDVSFPIFIGNAIEYLTAGRSGRNCGGSAASHTTIDRVLLDLPAGTAIVLATGASDRTFDIGGERALAREVPIGPFDRAGVYRLQTSDGRSVEPAAVVVNLASERESALLRTLEASAPRSQTIGPSGSEAGPREVWHWFVLAAFALLTVEWFVYAWRMKG